MIKFFSALSVAGSVAALAPMSVTAGSLYLNPEFNTSIGSDTGVGGAILEGHIGYEFDNGAYIQVGPAASFPDSGEMEEIEISGKAGMSSGPLYGEVSFGTGDELVLGFKTGAKFSF